jgi:hypothetical protein
LLLSLRILRRKYNCVDLNGQTQEAGHSCALWYKQCMGTTHCIYTVSKLRYCTLYQNYMIALTLWKLPRCFYAVSTLWLHCGYTVIFTDLMSHRCWVRHHLRCHLHCYLRCICAVIYTAVYAVSALSLRYILRWVYAMFHWAREVGHVR